MADSKASTATHAELTNADPNVNKHATGPPPVGADAVEQPTAAANGRGQRTQIFSNVG